jgi:hypothetical protein
LANNTSAVAGVADVWNQNMKVNDCETFQFDSTAGDPSETRPDPELHAAAKNSCVEFRANPADMEELVRALFDESTIVVAVVFSSNLK